jgi:hypothetical protein
MDTYALAEVGDVLVILSCSSQTVLGQILGGTEALSNAIPP